MTKHPHSIKQIRKIPGEARKKRGDNKQQIPDTIKDTHATFALPILFEIDQPIIQLIHPTPMITKDQKETGIELA